MNSRNWSIRSKIIALVAVPLTALLALWIFATALTVGPAFNLLSARTLLEQVAKPGEILVAELQIERRLSVEYLSAQAADGRTLAAQRVTTDRAVAEFRRAASSEDAQDASSALLRARIAQIFVSLDGLSSGRGYIDRREVDAAGAQNSYSSIIDYAFRMFTATATFNDPQIDREIRALTAIGRGREWLSQADSLLAGAHAAGRFSGAGLGQLIQTIGTQRFLYVDAVADLPEAERAAYQRLIIGDPFVRLGQMQDTLVQTARAGSPPPVQARAWQSAYEPVVQQLRAYEAAATESLADRAAPAAVGILLRLALAGILGLAAVVVSVIVSVRVGRSLVGRLVLLRAAALELAGERLPSVVRRLQRGETVDVAAEVPPLEYGSDELGQLGRAFTEVQRTAVQSAVDEANVRKGLNEVFLNIARRSQTLLHRQLALLDRMERRQTDPKELEDLYNADHLATRMRRHAEDLVILAGATPGRGWRNPVPVVDVIRGAISEVEDYKRIDVSAVETSSVIGRAVGDVIHLLAELLENAASFSPPHTRVHVAGQVVPNGYAVEIEDRGLGMSAEALDDANRRLLQPPEFDPADSARLGLFVVAQLAGRHGIRVQLRSSPYGGVTAVALIPGALITAGQGPAALTAGPSQPSATPAPWDRPTAGIGAGPAPGRQPRAGMPFAGPNGRPPGRPAALADLTALDGPVLGGPVLGGPVVAEPSAGLRSGSAVPAGTESPRRSPTGPTVEGPPRDGLTVDGLAQRRRTRLRAAPAAAAPVPPAPAAPVPPIPAAPVPPAPPAPVPPIPAAAASAPAAPAASPSAPAAGPPPDPADDDGLPRRVRQASLVAHLRRPAQEPSAEPPGRSPEQVRALMSALQAGTARGREAAYTAEAAGAAAPYGAHGPQPPADWFTDAPPGDGPAPGTSWADAATAGFPLTTNRDTPASDNAAPDNAAPDNAAPDNAAPDIAVAETVVHHGEIVRPPVNGAGAEPPPWPTIAPTTAPGAEPTHPDKDA